MIVAKQFRWEGAHRLPWHDGLCKNNHGHSYKMEASVDGAVDARDGARLRGDQARAEAA